MKEKIMFMMARLFGKTCTGYDVMSDKCCMLTMKLFHGTYYVMKLRWLK